MGLIVEFEVSLEFTAGFGLTLLGELLFLRLRLLLGRGLLASLVITSRVLV